MARASAASDARLRAIFATTAVPMVLLDQAGRIFDANRALAGLLGCTAAELRGRTLDELTVDADAGDDARQRERVRSGKVESFVSERRYLVQNGQSLWGRLTISGVRGADDHEVELLLGIFEDVTRRRLIEDQYRAIFDVTGDAIGLVDNETHRFLQVDPAWERLSGYTQEEMRGMSTRDLVHPDSLPVYQEHAGQEYARLRLQVRRRDGATLNVEVSARNFELYGRPTRLVVARDITEDVNALQALEDRVAARTRELSTFFEVAGAITSTLALQPLLDMVLDLVRPIVDYTEARVMLRDGDDLCVAAGRGTHMRVADVRVPIAQTVLFQELVRGGGPVIVEDLHDESTWSRFYRRSKIPYRGVDRMPVRSVLAVALGIKGRVIGVLRFDHAQPGFYGPREAEIATAFARQVAIAIENARLFEEAEGRRHEIEALHRAEEALHHTLQPYDVLDALVGASIDILHADKAAVMLWDGRREHIAVEVSRGFSEESLRQMVYAPDEAIASLAAARGEIVDAEDADSDPRIAPRVQAIHRTEAVRSLISVPIESSGEVLGVFSVYCRTRRTFGPDDRRLLQALAQRAAVALDNARLFEDERAMRERLEVTLAAGKMGTWEWNAATNIVGWSPQLGAIHGFESGTSASPLDAYLSHIYPDDRESVRRAIGPALEGADYHVEYRIIWPDGGVHWVEAFGRSVRNAQGEPIGLRGVCQDVTARKAQEVERAHLVERQRQASEARAALEERQRLARELHDSVSQALYGIALGAQTALGALRDERDVEAGIDATQYVLSLAEAALAEMRALIFELRPESLEQEGLIPALERQVASLRAAWVRG